MELDPQIKRITNMKKTLHHALESCDKGLISVISNTTDVDKEDALKVMNILKKDQDIYKTCLTPLQGAILLGRDSICKQLLEEGAVLESSTDIPHPLCLAFQKRHFNIAKLLIDAGADVQLSFGGKLPLCYALDAREPEPCPLEIVKGVIEAGFDVNDKINISTGETLLHYAVNGDRSDIIRYLLSKDIILDQGDNRGITPFHYAVLKNSSPLVRLFVTAGADKNVECSEGYTPMLFAIKNNRYDMVVLLLEELADIHYINTRSTCPMTPLHFAANSGQLKITQLLLKKEARVNLAVPSTGEMPLHSAVRAKVTDNISLDSIVEMLIEKGSDIEAMNKFDRTPLQVAIMSQNTSLAKILINNGANLENLIEESQDCFQTTFHLIARTFNKDLIELSLRNGANYMAQDDKGLFPCNSALSFILDCHTQGFDCPNEEIVLETFKLFWRQGFPFNSTFSVNSFKLGVVHSLRQVENIVKKQKMLLNGIKAQNLKMVQKAFTEGADPQFCSTEQFFPLHLIASKGNELILEEFLRRSVIVNYTNKKGVTPLHLAAKAGHLNCCRLLLEYGAVYNPLAKKSKATPKDFAKENNHIEVVAFFTEIEKYFKCLKKANFEEHLNLFVGFRQNVKIIKPAMNCCHRDGNTLLGRAVEMDFVPAINHLMRVRLEMEKLN